MKGLNQWLKDIGEEVLWAKDHFPPASTLHEAYALIEEELDELWECVKAKKDYDEVPKGVTKEAIQVGAMAVWLLLSFGGKDE